MIRNKVERRCESQRVPGSLEYSQYSLTHRHMSLAPSVRVKSWDINSGDLSWMDVTTSNCGSSDLNCKYVTAWEGILSDYLWGHDHLTAWVLKFSSQDVRTSGLGSGELDLQVVREWQFNSSGLRYKDVRPWMLGSWELTCMHVNKSKVFSNVQRQSSIENLAVRRWL